MNNNYKYKYLKYKNKYINLYGGVLKRVTTASIQYQGHEDTCYKHSLVRFIIKILKSDISSKEEITFDLDDSKESDNCDLENIYEIL